MMQELEINSEMSEESYNDRYSDDGYEPESEVESAGTDEDYVVSSESYSEQYESDDSTGHKRKRKKNLGKSSFKIIKRPALKNKLRFRKSSTDESSTTTTDWEGDEERDSEPGDSDMSPYEKVEDEPGLSIEKVLKTRLGKTGDVGPPTSLYSKLTSANLITCESDNQEEQYLIKWVGKSYAHCTWETLSSIKNNYVKGLKKVENYIKKNQARKNLDSSEAEILDIFNGSVEDNVVLDRIISKRSTETDPDKFEYLCKWLSLPYEDATWEDQELISKLSPSAIDTFNARQQDYTQKFDIRQLSSINYNKDRLFKNLDNLKVSSHQNEGFILRDYQIEGVKWLIHSCFIGNSVILADEMGLGKTVQIINYLSYLKSEYNVGGPHIVIVPLSTLDGWVKHFTVWAPSLNVVPFVGNAKSREIIKLYELVDPVTDMLKFNVLVTTYELVFKELAFFCNFNWFSMVIDEGHRIKNENSMLHQALYDFKSYHRVLMTGTPLQNSLRELWSLLHFIMPHKFTDPDSIEKYGQYEDKQLGYEELKSRISEYILRRTKKDVEKSLPPKVEQILRVDMTNSQKKYYKWILTKNYVELLKESKGSSGGFLNIIMELKKCCNHVDLVLPNLQGERKNDISALLVGSGKLILLDKLLCRLHENKSRVLIFSQMVSMLDVLSHYLSLRGFNFQRLDGSMNEASRIRSIDHFNSVDSNDFCFLLSTKAGGLGINLVTADTVIIYDSDWNPQNDLQAQARAHRIGQTKQVKIYRLVTKSSIEEDIIERAKRKMVLDHLVIQTMDSKLSDPASIKFNKDELSLILKFGADELFKENIQEDGKEPLQELDLDAIMKLAERGDGDNLTQLTKGEEFLSSFKVANFKTCETDEPLETVAWQDIIPRSEIEKIENENYLKKQAELYLPPRRKEQVKHTFEDSPSDEDDPNSLKIESVNKKKITKFIKAYQKFPNAASRIEHVLTSAGFESTDITEKTYIFAEIANFIEIALKNQKDGTKFVKINGITCNLDELAQSRKITDVINNKIGNFLKDNPSMKDSDLKTKFSLPIKNQRSKWNSKWTKSDDSKLFVGVYFHGLGNWQAMYNDKVLRFSKLKDSKGRIAPSPLIHQHLSRLVKTVQKVKSSSKPKKRTSDHSKKSPSTTLKDNKVTKTPKNNKMIPPTKSKTSSPIDDETKKKCVSVLRPVKRSLYHLEGVKVKDLSTRINEIKKIGSLIHSLKLKSSDPSIDTIWNFVSLFTSVPHRELKSFYLKNCIEN